MNAPGGFLLLGVEALEPGPLHTATYYYAILGPFVRPQK